MLQAVAELAGRGGWPSLGALWFVWADKGSAGEGGERHIDPTQ